MTDADRTSCSTVNRRPSLSVAPGANSGDRVTAVAVATGRIATAVHIDLSHLQDGANVHPRVIYSLGLHEFVSKRHLERFSRFCRARGGH